MTKLSECVWNPQEDPPQSAQPFTAEELIWLSERLKMAAEMLDKPGFMTRMGDEEIARRGTPQFDIEICGYGIERLKHSPFYNGSLPAPLSTR